MQISLEDIDGGQAVAVCVNCCDRCGTEHIGLGFRRLTRAPLDTLTRSDTHWAICPTTGEPILLRVESLSAREILHRARQAAGCEHGESLIAKCAELASFHRSINAGGPKNAVDSLSPREIEGLEWLIKGIEDQVIGFAGNIQRPLDNRTGPAADAVLGWKKLKAQL